MVYSAEQSLGAGTLTAFRKNLPLLLIWLAISILLVLVVREQIATGIGWGPDDQLRQVQLRDWLAGQSWFDTTQYRIGVPDSQPMHWPRWIEIPLALIVLTLTPLVGAATAETAAMVIVPLIALGIAMWLVLKITEQLFDRKIALLAAALAATAVPIIVQLRPMRVDHHGWQIVLALTALWTMFWPDRRKAGLVLGFSLALWLSISLEGLPLSVAFIALLAWRWAIEMDEGGRLFWTLVSFLVSSFAFYLLTQGSFDIVANYCDAISPAHLIACIAGGAVILPAIRLLPESIIARVIALIVGGAAVLTVLFLTAPQCVGPAFGDIDPLVRDYWLVNVAEGLPVWHQDWKTTATLMGGSILIGLITLTYLHKNPGSVTNRDRLFTLGYAIIWSFAVSLIVQRATAVAAAYALPLLAWAVHGAFLKARSITSPVIRIFATASVVFLIMPGPLLVSVFNSVAGDEKEETSGAAANSDQIACDTPTSLQRLNVLPQANIVAPFNLGPKILALTPHSVLATSHHRNDEAMADQIKLFTSSPNKARDILEQRNIRYIAVCKKEPELDLYVKKHPNGLWAQLAKGAKFQWLQPVHIRDSDLTVWRVEPKTLRN